jgi:hypothetical protein
MCQACLALAHRRSGTSPDDDGGGWLARPAPSRFAAAADWVEEPPADDPPDAEPDAADGRSGQG